MALPHEKLATSLEILHKLQGAGRRVFRSAALSRVHRERLIAGGFLQPIVRGWVMSSDPAADPGDTTPWFSSFWEFCAAYCDERFGDDWHLSADQSLMLHAGNTAVPRQILVYSSRGSNNVLELPFQTTLIDTKETARPPETDITKADGLRLFRVEPGLIRSGERFFQQHPIDARTVLCGPLRPSDLLGRLLDGGHSAIAGRLVGALRRVGIHKLAEDIVSTMTAAGYRVIENDPFEGMVMPLGNRAPALAAAARRVTELWAGSAEVVARHFPQAPGRPNDIDAYLRRVEERYVEDAYHSLSIEGYRVTPALIERVRRGDWNPDGSEEDHDHRNTLAARGYWGAFQLVKASIAEILRGAEAADVVERDHLAWYRALFQPSVEVGLIAPGSLAGYRRHPVYIKGSRHVPMRAESVDDAMAAMFASMRAERRSGVQAVLGHWLLGYIHPFPDGNGRTARFMMNALLAAGGYPWTVVRFEERERYLAALDMASLSGDVTEFSHLLGELLVGQRNRAGDAV